MNETGDSIDHDLDPKPETHMALLMDASGPCRQCGLFEFNVFNCGQPTVASNSEPRVASVLDSSAPSQPPTPPCHERIVIPEEDPNRVIDGEGEDELAEMLGESEGDEGDGDVGDLNNNEPNRFPFPPTVHDVYISHCNLLDSSKDSQS